MATSQLILYIPGGGAFQLSVARTSVMSGGSLSKALTSIKYFRVSAASVISWFGWMNFPPPPSPMHYGVLAKPNFEGYHCKNIQLFFHAFAHPIRKYLFKSITVHYALSYRCNTTTPHICWWRALPKNVIGCFIRSLIENTKGIQINTSLL
jgi:hypothetical protein